MIHSFLETSLTASVVSEVTKRFGLSVELWETAVLPQLLPAFALKLRGFAPSAAEKSGANGLGGKGRGVDLGRDLLD